MYEQGLLKIVEPVKKTTISRLNKGKKWEYGYNKEHDVVVLSHDGQIGEIYEIQNLKIALPKEKEVARFDTNKFERIQLPKALSKIKTIFDWEEYSVDFKEEWYEYIDKEFSHREEGFWLYTDGKGTSEGPQP